MIELSDYTTIFAVNVFVSFWIGKLR